MKLKIKFVKHKEAFQSENCRLDSFALWYIKNSYCEKNVLKIKLNIFRRCSLCGIPISYWIISVRKPWCDIRYSHITRQAKRSLNQMEAEEKGNINICTREYQKDSFSLSYFSSITIYRLKRSKWIIWLTVMQIHACSHENVFCYTWTAQNLLLFILLKFTLNNSK